MIDFELENLNRDAQWSRVLEAYQQLVRTKQHDSASDGWVNRLESVEGVEDEVLSRIHGKLIALGFLRFQLTDSRSGMRYQLSPLGKGALARRHGTTTDRETDSPERAQTAESKDH